MISSGNYSTIRYAIRAESGFEPWGSEDEVGQLLFSLCRMVGAKRVLEVGAWRGATALWLADAVGLDDVWMIDKLNSLSPLFPRPNRLMFGESVPTLNYLRVKGMEFDLCFLDTDHQLESTAKELEAIWQIVRPGGLICLHDAIACEGVALAIRNFQNFTSRIETITLGTPNHRGLSVIRKL